MNAPEMTSLLAAANAAANAAINDGKRSLQREAELNSARIEVVADKLALCAQPYGQPEEARLFFQLCLSLARGIDYGVANNEVPEKASKLPPILIKVCCRKNEFFLQAAIMVLMISVKNACKMGWFTTKDTQELLTLANEVGSNFSTMAEVNHEEGILSNVSNIMSRFYPRYRIGHVIASLEAKPGYGTYLLDFHISKNVPYSPEEKIRLFVAMKDNIDTSSCIVNPQKVNFLLNGRAVERRSNIFMDPGPQFPSVVNHLLKYGTNLLQAVGQFNGHYVILIAFISNEPVSSLPSPQDYVQPDPAILNSESDSEIIEGPSRISLNCPITYRRIRTPVKGHLCKHYQCFDLSNYVELNSKRPSWRCPHCNQSVCFTDLRVYQRMAKVLQEVGENVSEVIISADGSWTAASSTKPKYDSHDKTSADQQEDHERPDSSGTDASCKVYDLTEEDDEMEIEDICEPVETKPVVHHNIQNQPVPASLISSPAPRISNENQYTPALVANALLSRSLSTDLNSANYNIRSEIPNSSAPLGFSSSSLGFSPLLTDSASPSLNRLPDNFQGNDYSTSSITRGQFAASTHLQEVLFPQPGLSSDFGGSRMIPRHVSRTQAAIQALPVQMPTPHQQHSRPMVSMPAANRSSVPFQAPLASNAHVSSNLGSNIDRQRQSLVNSTTVSSMSPTSLQNRSAPRVVGHSTPNPSVNMRMPQTLSQPPHLRSSHVPHNHIHQQGVSHGGLGNSPSTVERIQLMAQHQHQLHSAQMRQPQTTSLHTQQAVRMATSSSIPVSAGPSPPPQAVSRAENLIDLHSEQNWRPTGRMRGSLTGQAYSAALSQFFGHATPSQPAQVPIPRPSGLATSTISPHLQALANRMSAQVSQVINRPPTTNASTGTQPEGPRGL